MLFISSELAEVIAMADRVLVMARGRITAEFTAADVTEEALVAASASDASWRPAHDRHRRRRPASPPRAAPGAPRNRRWPGSRCCCCAAAR